MFPFASQSDSCEGLRVSAERCDVTSVFYMLRYVKYVELSESTCCPTKQRVPLARTVTCVYCITKSVRDALATSAVGFLFGTDASGGPKGQDARARTIGWAAIAAVRDGAGIRIIGTCSGTLPR